MSVEIDEAVVERVAQAVNRARYGDTLKASDHVDLNDEDTISQGYARRLARAAITAYLSATPSASSGRVERMEAALKRLGAACWQYRHFHDRLGGDHIDTGRAWDEMRRAEGHALAVLADRAALQPPADGGV